MKNFNFIFLGDILQVENNQGYSIVDNYILRKAHSQQIKTIKKYLDEYKKLYAVNIFEHDKRDVKSGTFKGGYEFSPVNKKDWNYWAIEHTNSQMEAKFYRTLALSSLDLTVLFESVLVDNVYRGIIQKELSSINFFINNKGFNLEPKIINEQTLAEVRYIYNAINEFELKKHKFDFIEKAISDFIKLKDISRDSPFMILGYFSILEILLTTNKSKNIIENSINHQLQKKIKLLNNRLDNPLNFLDYFKGSNTNTTEKIIEKLYQYRSDIAHGNISDFEKE